jgi:hypothetical protein
VRLVVVDTLARTLIGGDENDPQDMGRYIANLGAIQAATGAHVCVVHHSGKNPASGARGHSSLLAAVDTAIEVVRESGCRTATIVKQKDGRDGDVLSFDLDVVDLGVDDDGDPITSCVVRQIEGEAGRPKAVRLSPSQRRALDLLREAINTSGEQPPAAPHMPAHGIAVKVDTWRGYCDRGGLSDTNDVQSKARVFRRTRQELIARGVVGTWDEWVWLA